MRLEIEAQGVVVVIRIHEKLTVDSAQELRGVVLHAAESNPAEIVLDLNGVPFIDSSGLGILLGIRKQLLANGIAISLTNPQERVLTVLRLTRLAAVFGLEKASD